MEKLSEAGRIRARSDTRLSLPAIQTLARRAGALALLVACSSILLLIIGVMLLRALPPRPENWVFWVAVILAVVQLGCLLLIWRVFVSVRDRFANRLKAVTEGLEDRVFLADAGGTPLSMLTAHGWMSEAAHDWLVSVHPDDRGKWNVEYTTELQHIELRLKDPDGNWRWHRLRATPVRDAKGAVREWVGTLHDIHDQKNASEHRDLVIGELRHRLKNLVAVIDALAKNSRLRNGGEPGVESFLQRFLGRLHALGAAGDLVLAGGQGTIEVAPLIQATLAPFSNDSGKARIRASGPNLTVSEELGAGLGLAVHELATNALKYGALSVPDGSVSLTWSTARVNGSEEVVFEWKERGGPAPVAPARPGFGTRMIKNVVAREKSGQVDMQYRPEGVHCRIAFARRNGASQSSEPITRLTR